jgi:hypothetical protein
MLQITPGGPGASPPRRSRSVPPPHPPPWAPAAGSLCPARLPRARPRPQPLAAPPRPRLPLGPSSQETENPMPAQLSVVETDPLPARRSASSWSATRRSRRRRRTSPRR